MLDSFAQDLRIGLRVLIKEKGFCALAVTVLALGICAVTTQFSIVNGVVLRGFAFPHADRLMTLRFIDPTPQPQNFFNIPPNQILSLDYLELRENQKSFEKIAAYIFQSTVNVSYNNNPQRYTGAYVTEDFFRILGVAPALFAVNQRTQEFGIRMALGADHSRILRMVLRQGALQLAVGLGLGLTFALVIAGVGANGINRQLNNTITPTDPATYLAVAALLALVALIATLVPARRATRVDPMVALRAE